MIAFQSSAFQASGFQEGTAPVIAQAYGGGRGYKDTSGEAINRPQTVALGSVYHPLISDRRQYAERLAGKKEAAEERTEAPPLKPTIDAKPDKGDENAARARLQAAALRLRHDRTIEQARRDEEDFLMLMAS